MLWSHRVHTRFAPVSDWYTSTRGTVRWWCTGRAWADTWASSAWCRQGRSCWNKKEFTISDLIHLIDCFIFIFSICEYFENKNKYFFFFFGLLCKTISQLFRQLGFVGGISPIVLERFCDPKMKNDLQSDQFLRIHYKMFMLYVPHGSTYGN